MIEPIHRIKNAESALNSLRSHSSVEIIEVDERLGSAEVTFEFTEDASLGTVRGIIELMSSSGWEEDTMGSELTGPITFEWSRMNLAIEDNEINKMIREQ